MSVVVIDPALDGNAARVARWDFTAAETAAMFRRSGAALAIHLTMAGRAIRRHTTSCICSFAM